MHRRSRLASLFLMLAVTAASLGLLASNAVFAGGNPMPVATVNNATGLLGETVTLTVTFDNASTGTGDQTGYGPYIDLFLDTTGPDGAPSFDGLVTTGIRATYLDQPLPWVEVIPITGPTYVHPLTGQTLSVPGHGARFQDGDTIVVLTLPFGSFTNTQPPAPINVTLRISNLADLGTPLPVTAVAGFRYGADPLDNPDVDPPLRQTTPSDAVVTPALWTLTKTYLGPEDETATGRNYPRRYRLDVDIADGQPVTNLQITDVLANSMRITGNTAAQMSARLYYTPGVPTEVFNPANLSGTATPAAPGGTLIYSFGDKTGVRGVDASFEFEFYIPRDTSAATPTVPQGTDSTFANNTGSSSAAWTPIDIRDPPMSITITLPPDAHTLQQHSLATQKSVTPVHRDTLVPTGGAIIPGSTLLRYDIDFQVSDYFAVQNVYLEDIISDGQRLFVRTSGGPSTVPTLRVENAYVTGTPPSRTNIAAAPFSGTGVIVYQERFTTRGTLLSDPTSPPSGPVFTILTPAPSLSGTTYVRFNISQELIARGVSGRLVGGDIPNVGGAPQNNNPPLFGPTRGRITFYTEVKDEFSDDFPSGDRSVDQLDILRNTVPQIRGEQIDTTTINNPTPTVIGQATDDTAASIELPIGDRSKTIYALNGQTTDLGDPVTVQPGDLVTYRLTYRLPISSFEDVQFIDFPPLPVFPVPDRLFFDASAAPGTIPGANMVSRGPNDTYLTTVNPPVTVRVATTGNITGYNPAGIGSFSGAPSIIDGVTLANGDRVLVKDQTDPRQNGVYVVTDAASGAWNRAADFDTAREITNGPLVGVIAGATNAGQHFRQVNPTFNTFNTDAITWALFITTDVYGNSFTFNFGWYDDVDGGRRTSLIDLLVTLRVADAAFANDLFLTNQLRINESSTNAGSRYFDEIVMFEVIRPNVTINKGIVGYNTIGLTLGGVTFNPPDDSTTFSGTPVYTATQASAIGSSDVSLLSDAGDRVRYAIVLQNEGRGDAYDVTVTDTIPADYIRPATLAAANFAVRRGDGTPLTGDVVSGTVRVATTAPLTGATYATSPNNGQFTNASRTIDGVTLNVGDRVLVKDQSVASQNGIYVVTSVFPATNQATLTRADDFDDDAELTGGYRVAVLGGLSSNANRAFSTPGPITLNTTPITWIDAGVSDYYATYNPLTGVFSVTLADNYTAGNTTAPTRDDRPGGLSRGASGPASNVVAVTNGSNTVIITYDVTLGDNVEPNRQIINTATLTHVATSDGGVDDQPDPFDTAQVTIRRPTIAKTLTATEIEDAFNNRQQTVIGELITYTLTLTVPEGIMSSSTLTDTLDTGLAFVDVTGVSASPALTFTGGGLPTVGATPANTIIGAGGQTITFNFGAITNSNRDNTVEETIVITYRAIVLNTSANQSGAQRNNRVGFSWVVPGQGSYALTPVEAANVTIIEPTLGVAKTLPSGVYDAGDLIDYTITFSHTAGSQGTAYDAVLTDTLPIDPFGSGSLILTPTVLSVTDSADALTVADFTLTGSNATSWTLSNSTPVDVAPGRVVTIVVRGMLSNVVMPGATITNTAFLRWTSLDGMPGQRSTHNAASTERTGADGPGGALNDYAATGSVAFIVPTVTPGKALIATSEAHTSGSNVAIGEIVRFRIAIGGPEASVYAFSLVDRLPPGLTFLNDGSARFVFIADNNITTAGVYDVAPVSCPAISPAGVTTLADVLNPAILPSSSINCTFGDSNISSSETSNTDVYASGTDVFFRFGNLSNNDNDAGEEFIVVEFNAIVDNDTFDPNDAGDVRSNTVVARMNPPGFGAFETAPSPEVTVTVVEPNIPFNAATNNKIATPASGDAFDVITYTVTYTNATGVTVTDAFDVRLLDVLPADMTLITGSVAVTSSCATGITNNSAGNTIDVTVGRVPPGCSVTVTYQATLNVSVIPGQTITNIATLTYTSLPGSNGTGGFFGSTAGSGGSATGERNGSGGINDYAGSDTALVTIVSPTLAKRIVATSEAHTADPLVLADFTNTGFDGLTGSWNTNVFTYPTFVRISGSATESGGGYITFASPVDLSNHTALALSARLVAGNGADNIDVHLQDADGTNWRWRFPASSFNFSTFTLAPQSLLGPHSTTIVTGTTPGLDLRNITRLEIRGDNGTAQFDIDIDAVIAFGNTAVPGEIVRYRLVATIPEGTSPNLQLHDNIPFGMRFINDNTVRVAFVSNSGGITSTSAGSQVPALNGAGLNITGNQDSVIGLSLAVGSGNGLAIGEGTSFDGNVSSGNDVGTDTDTFNDGTDVYFRLGNVVNNDNDADLEFVVVEFNAQVLNTFSDGNQSGRQLNNDFRYLRSGIQVGATSVTNDVNRVTVVEPQINNLSKTISSAPPADAGDVFTYTLRFANGVAWPSSPAVPVRVATTSNIAEFNPTGGFGGTGQFTNAPAIVDGVSLNVGDRILVRSQTNPAQNGVYTLVFIDPFTGARTWDRATDLDSTTELAIGYRVFVQEGSLAGRTYYLDEPLPSSINAGPILWRDVDPAMTVAVATTGNLGGGTFNSTGGTLGRGTLSTTATVIDGVTVNATNFPVGTRILVKNQSTASQNGIYRVTGFSGSTMNLERVAEFDSRPEAIDGTQVYVIGGTINAGRTFAVLGAPSGTPITTSLTFALVDQVTAFDVTLYDQLPPTLELLGVQIDAPTGTTATNGSTLGVGGVISYTLDRLDSVQDITSGRTDVVVTATVRVVPGTVAGAQITNTARVQYTSLPGERGTIANPTGSSVAAGTAGTQNGERTGGDVPNPINNSSPSINTIRNNYSVGAIALNRLAQPSFDKHFQGGSISDDDTSVPGTSGSNVAVGEAVLYDLLVTLPEGTTNNLQVVDAVPDGMRFDTSFNGVGYQIVTSAGGLLAENFSDPAAVASPTLTVSGTGTLGQDGVDALFIFGNVTVTDDNNPNNNAFIIRVRLIVTNTMANQSGATRANGGALRYNDGYSGADVTLRDPTEPQVTVVEPTPSILKSVSGAAADAGDLITYTIRLENSAPRSEMTAYDVVISDTIAPELINPTIVAVSAIGAPDVDVADFEIVTVGSDRILRTTAPITLPLGSTVIITFTGDLTSTVTTDQIITNRASMFWSSTPGANPDERNGSDVPNPPECSSLPGNCNLDNTQLNNYGLISSVTTTAIAPVVVSKSVIEGVAPSTTGTNVTIGEIVTYRLAISLPEGVTSGLVITDTIPAGMAYLPGSATLVTSALAAGDPPLNGGHLAGAGTLAFNGVFSDPTDPAVTPIGSPRFLDGTDVLFTFDQITLPGDNDTRNNTFFIRYQVVVLDVPGNTGFSGSQTTLTNSGQFDVPSTPQPPANLLIDPNGATVTVVEPELAIAKSVAPTSGDAGDPVTYTITLSHTARSLADAFDVTITDALPATIGSSLTAPITIAQVNATHSVDGDITGNFGVAGNTLTTTTPFTLTRGATVTLTITGVLRQSVQPGETIINTVVLTSTSLPGPNQDLSPDTTGVSDGTDRERSRSASSSVTLSTGQSAFSKALFATSATHTSGADITIGEIISYTLIVDLPEGTIRNLVLTDDLPAGLDYEGFTVITEAAQSGGLLTQDFAGTIPSITVTGGAGSGDDVTLTFDSDVVVTGDNNAANNRFLVVVRVRALDEPGMVGLIPPGQTTLTNTATMRYTDGSNITRTFTDTETVRVVEPRLTITKNIVQTVVNAGDPITITLTVTNTGTSDAFDVVITDTLPPDFDAATTTFGAAGSDYPTTFTPSRIGSEVRYEGGPIPAGATVTFTFRVNLTGTVTPGVTITNTARIARSTSLPGDDPTERVQTPVDSSDTITIRSNSLSGFVYVDADNNGAFDGDETPIQGVTITLTGIDHLGNAVNLTATTSITGYYRFDNLRPGTYTLMETQPSGYLDGTDAIGTQGGTTGNDVLSNIVLPVDASTNGENNNFGELLPARITGFVYEDNNNNGNFETGLGESGISGVTITLSGTDDRGNGVLLTTTTTITGFYTFDNLRPGTYTVIETQPSGYLDGRDTAGTPGGGTTTINDRITGITLTPGMASLNNNFGELRPASLSGRVYYDVNNSGSLDAGEPGISGVTITLTGTDDLGNLVTLTTTTDASGVYTFTNLRPGTYTVSETQPVGYFDGAESVGSAGGSIISNDVIGNVTLSAGVAATGYNFGELLTARITGFVYEDNNNNGNFETGLGESGIPGVTITLSGTDDLGNNVFLTTTTTITGFYTFDNLRPGTYTVIETQPSGYLDGRDTAGTLGGDTSLNDRIAGITLTFGAASLNNNFGELRPASLSGRVYRDDNNNGIPDTGEPGIGGVTITLTGTDDLGNPVNLTATTTVTGYYRFDNLRPGTYTVSETQPAAYNDGIDRVGTAGGILSNDQISDIVLGAGINAVNYDFGERGTFVSGIVWIDTDRDGTLDGGENGRLGGVTITLRDSLGNIVATTTTLADGSYRFDNLLPGNYTIEQTQPTGYGSSTPNTLSVTVPLTGLTDQNFGETVSTLSGYVYVDSNNNGVFDAGESGIGGVTITLTGVDANGNAVTRTTLTQADGSYRFENLLAGTYTIGETQPLIYSDGLESIGTIGGTPVGALVSNDVIGNITLPAGTDGIEYNFGELANAGLGDRVWLDRDGDGAQEPGEPGIGGVTVYLDLNNNGVRDIGEPTAVTDTNGQYFFGGLAGGTYTVRVDATTLPGGVSQTYDLDGATATPHAATASLAAGATRTDVDFGYRGTASIGDRVWLDRDGDGVQDAGEPGLSGVIVYLDLNGNGVRDADEPFAVTDAAGNYLIGGLLAGTYTVRVDASTLPSGVSATYDLDGIGTPSVVTGVTLTSGEARTDVDFGYRGTASIGDRVWNDANANGIQDARETGVSGIVVALYDSTGTLLITTTTDLNGNYLFDNLPPGTYIVGVGATPGRSISPRGAGSDSALDSDINRATRRSNPITLAIGEDRRDIDIGLYQLASVGSLVWLDRDLDGIREADEPGIGGIEVRLLRSDGTVVATQTTDANGYFMFTDVEPGEYRIAFSVPSGYYVSPFQRGNDRSIDSDADPATGLTPIFTLTPGQIDPTWFMGLSPISPTAIQLTRFSAERGAQSVVVRWETAAEYGTRGFYLERSATGSRSDAVRITDRLIPARGSVSSGASYEWNDTTAAPGTRYTYWLIEETVDGSTHIYGPATLASTTGSGYTVMLPLIVR
jgi:fimbrial isopeptide formation D2 family protein/uncharacterized repeat protein (TIGR01451 family)